MRTSCLAGARGGEDPRQLEAVRHTRGVGGSKVLGFWLFFHSGTSAGLVKGEEQEDGEFVVHMCISRFSHCCVSCTEYETHGVDDR